MSRRASLACLAVLPLPVMLLFEDGTGDVVGMVALLCAVLAPAQLIVQSVVVWKISARELGRHRVAYLRVLMFLHIAGAMLAAPIVYTALTDPGYFELPLIWMVATPFVLFVSLMLIGSDAALMAELDSLARDSRIPSKGWATELYRVAKPAFVGGLVFTAIAPCGGFGWEIGPFMWLAATAVGFERLRDVAEAAERRLAA